MKIKLLELAAFLSLFICIVSCLAFEKDCEGIRSEVMRLHVIANSDSTADQELKLKVRDTILKKSKEIFSESSDLLSAQKSVEAGLETLKSEAKKAVKNEGFNYDVNVVMGPSYFPTRQYDDITLPAGCYNSVKVIIGEGEGKNWWCVLFPPMCLPAASKNEVKLKDVLNEDELKLVKSAPKYEVRFWIVEKLQEIKRSYKTDA